MARNTVADLQRDIAARSSKNTFGSSVNKDGTLTVQKNGANVHKVFYVSGGGTITDANKNGDVVVVIDPNGIIGVADATVYLNSLT